MVLNILLLDGSERAETNVQRYVCKRNAFIRNFLQQLRRKVQSCRGAAAEPGSREYTVW